MFHNCATQGNILKDAMTNILIYYGGHNVLPTHYLLMLHCYHDHEQGNVGLCAAKGSNDDSFSYISLGLEPIYTA